MNSPEEEPQTPPTSEGSATEEMQLREAREQLSLLDLIKSVGEDPNASNAEKANAMQIEWLFASPEIDPGFVRRLAEAQASFRGGARPKFGDRSSWDGAMDRLGETTYDAGSMMEFHNIQLSARLLMSRETKSETVKRFREAIKVEIQKSANVLKTMDNLLSSGGQTAGTLKETITPDVLKKAVMLLELFGEPGSNEVFLARRILAKYEGGQL